jgi:predicted nucleic acid-binding OB-fold protein
MSNYKLMPHQIKTEEKFLELSPKAEELKIKISKLILKIEKKTQWHIILNRNGIRIFGYYTNGISKIKSNEYRLLPRLTKI